MRLTKHHGLGNDFLVLVDLDERHLVDGDLAREVCDRHRGVGADGLLSVTPGTAAPFRMVLHNEDGSRAEMSGNGISCLAQALLLGGAAEGDVVKVETDAGLRTVEVVDIDGPGRHRLRVAMGPARLGAARTTWEVAGVERAVHVDVGNPHVVCHVPDPALGPDLAAFGASIDEATPGGTNVELLSPGPDPASVRMTVYERGVGPTQACGTGAVAVATAAHAWGLAPATVTVHQPGGAATVEVGDPAHLTVPVVAVAVIDWPWP